MTNAYQVYTGARQLLEGYAAAMQPLCRREGLAPNGVDILLFLANNPGLDTARDICTYRGLKPGIVSFHVEKLVQEGYLLRMTAGLDPQDLAAFRRCLEGFQRNLSQMTQEDDQ